ncbi:Protein of uncharacterised function (DUF2910) [Mycobacteroides abscessus subsp. bolletii]|uniref:GAP family protein n=1 Tax=Mycobacteroides abscessus TaxID=36809 RepID=UPI00092BE93C|nr:GAP family protein [Mycobacteroides abscessus]SHY39152.1 Protein of uncharacterised function (DUF2910) [Mycobacteroides abscessus subsp. bolletii]SKP94359.1 Protein of uncharacterised function (DUF2910) [Mycobacteroides abscessus subsp. bolletii]SKQ21446.1 Protein of uncharacterised function (DUF2910) [Mycobacteroides abscessus subsp. bolletii]SKQ28506.1 Protein of uncharacterised function (DUF2910) [Mycobacteroides abscessus subsp. bolletii]
MLTLLLALTGWAFLDSLNVLNVAVTSAVVYDSRLGRRSPLPGGLSFIAGLFTATTVFGLCAVLGINFLTDVIDFQFTPKIRYWGELALGLVLICLACYPAVVTASAPGWATNAIRRRPWLLGFVGIAIGLGQAPTAIPYLAGLAMLSTRNPLPPLWPLIVIGYCAITVWPPLLVLALSIRRPPPRAQRIQRTLVRVLTKYGPIAVRILFLLIGIALICDGLLHHHSLW